jgi:ADP-heptose:LPS heptosyltransferase
MRRILLIRLGGLGDIVFTLPAVSAIRAAFPEAHITFLSYGEFTFLLEGFPRIDAVLKLNRDLYRHPRTLLPQALRLLIQLRRGKYDLVVDFQGFGETGLFAKWTGAPERWGMVYRPSRRWAYTKGVRRELYVHPVDYQLEVVRQAGGIPIANPPARFLVPENAQRQARHLFSEWELEVGKPTIFIQPFSHGQQKNWGLQDYLQLARNWKAEGLQVLFGGGPSEREALEPVCRAGFAVAAGAPLLVSAGLVGLSTVILGGDTGLLHLAAAMGKRVVMLIGSKYPGNCFPYGHPEWAVAPEGCEIVSAIKPEPVIQACAQALAEEESRRQSEATVVVSA